MIKRRVARFETFHKYKNQNESNNENLEEDKSDKISILENKFLRHIDSANKKMFIEKEIKNIGNGFNRIKNTNTKDEIPLINYLKDKENSLNSSKELNEGFIELLIYILRKSLKNETESDILKYYFLSLDQLVSIFLPLDLNIYDMMSKLPAQIQFEKKLKNNILWKCGDKCEKLYIIIKGNVSLLRFEKKGGECTKLEYIKYLIILYLYQENSLISKIISENEKEIKIKENIFFTLLTVFKFYKAFINNENFLEKYNSISNFLETETSISNYIFKLKNFPPIDSLKILNYNENIIQELFDFYAYIIKEINSECTLDIKLNLANFNDNIFYESKKSNKIMMFLDLYALKGKNFKRLNELHDKINSYLEIEPSKLYKGQINDYLQRLNFEKCIKSIRKYELDYLKIKKKNSPIENSLNIQYFSYREMAILKEGNVIGEMAIKEGNNKTNETLITKEDCYFAVITKHIYDSCYKSSQDKSNVRNIFILTKSPIFKGISMNYFMNKIFSCLKKKTINKGDILFRKGDKREKLYFIIRGELELKLNITISEINDTIKSLGGEINYSKLDDIFDDYPKLKTYFNDKKMEIRFFSFKDMEIVGLDDITVKNKYLFDCECISYHTTKLYELKYSIFEDYIRLEKLVSENHENYINYKRNIIIKRILEKRNCLCMTEAKRINIALGKIKKIKKGYAILKDGYLPMTIPEPECKEPPPLKIEIQRTFQKKKTYKKKDNNLKDKNNNYFSVFNSKFKPTLLNLYTLQNEKSEIKKKKLKNKSLIQDIIDLNLHTAQEDERIKNLKKFHFFDKLNLSHKYNLRIDSNLVNKRKTKNENIDDVNTLNKNKFQNSSFNLNKTFYKYGFGKYFKKICNKPFIPNIANSRTKKNIVPFSGKISLKKRNSPLIYKENSTKYIDKRSIDTEPNFFKYNQQIFTPLLDEANNKNKLSSRSLIVNKENWKAKTIKIRNKKKSLKFTSDFKLKNEFIIKSIKKNTNNNISKLLQYQYPKKYGIIDFLFLDNWEERTQFEKNFFQKKNINI